MSHWLVIERRGMSIDRSSSSLKRLRDTLLRLTAQAISDIKAVLMLWFHPLQKLSLRTELWRSE
jgi:hypothetical protein